jgi:NTP pyrophosphatase (non-canonical NTP hydrolase)
MEPYSEFVAWLFAKRTEGADGLTHAALGIGGEAGEIVDIIKKHWVYGKELDREHLIEEIGDEMFYIVALCNLLGVTLADCIMQNMDKLRRRYPQGYSDAAAMARADKVLPS